MEGFLKVAFINRDTRIIGHFCLNIKSLVFIFLETRVAMRVKSGLIGTLSAKKYFAQSPVDPRIR